MYSMKQCVFMGLRKQYTIQICEGIFELIQCTHEDVSTAHGRWGLQFTTPSRVKMGVRRKMEKSMENKAYEG